LSEKLHQGIAVISVAEGSDRTNATNSLTESERISAGKFSHSSNRRPETSQIANVRLKAMMSDFI
jgi:hypothetical protein